MRLLGFGQGWKKLDCGATWYYQGAMTVKSSISLADEQHAFAKTLADAKYPLVIVGQAAARRPDGHIVLSAAARIALTASKDKNMGAAAFNVLHTAASRVGGLARRGTNARERPGGVPPAAEPAEATRR